MGPDGCVRLDRPNRIAGFQVSHFDEIGKHIEALGLGNDDQLAQHSLDVGRLFT